MRFSAKFEASKGKIIQIVEDAPIPTRIGYIKGILPKFIGVDGGYRDPRQQPLEIIEVHHAFIALTRKDMNPWEYDNTSELDALTCHIKGCIWGEFYDFTELVGRLLITKKNADPSDNTEHFKCYQNLVNELFKDDNIGWSLNDRAELIRQIPKFLAQRIETTESLLTDGFDTARLHYQKSLRYLHQYPIDEANSIKEIVSAIESVAKGHFPKASTLGQAVKFMRKDKRYAPLLVDALEKLYAYSNATPLVRHGHTEKSRLNLYEAELALLLGVAFIRYVIEAGRDANSKTK